VNSTIDKSSIVNNNTYYTNPGVSMTHIINGMAGNIESHSTLNPGQVPLNITAVLDDTHYGFSKLTVVNATTLTWSYVRGDGGVIGDELTLLKRPGKSGGGNGTSSSSSSASATKSTTSVGTGSVSVTKSSISGSTTGSSKVGSSISVGVTVTTVVVTSYTTYCPGPTTFTQGSSTYTVTEVSQLIQILIRTSELMKKYRLPL
jgi:hypothetical protein